LRVVVFAACKHQQARCCKWALRFTAAFTKRFSQTLLSARYPTDHAPHVSLGFSAGEALLVQAN
jgi:hypothetical protein